MSDLANVQLPTHVYFEQAFYNAEQALLFSKAPLYYGHELMVPNNGDFHTLEWMGHGKMLMRHQDSIALLSNVCRHRQAIINKGRGNGNNVVCKIHGWTYANDGDLMGAPHFPVNPCMNLGKTELTRWHGLLFDAKRNAEKDLAGMEAAQHLNFQDYKYDKTILTEYNFNWKTFIEVYLEDYHVVPYHPGLGNFVDCDQLKWQFGDWYSVQTVGVNNQLLNSGSEVYSRWHEQVRKIYQDKQPEFGAIWLTYYPNIMVEWYPHVLVVSAVVPKGVEQCTVITEFYYPEEILDFEPEFVAAEQAAYFETAVEDDDICYRMHEGRRALYQRGESEVGPYQTPTEDGMKHFHEFMRRELGEHIRD